MADLDRAPTIHATCIVIDGHGVLIRGRSGAGKTSLALALLAEADKRGFLARLVADDRVYVSSDEGNVLAQTPLPIAGLIERRGQGVFPIAYVPEAIVELLVDVREADTDELQGSETVCGVELPLLMIPRAVEPQTDIVFRALKLGTKRAP